MPPKKSVLKKRNASKIGHEIKRKSRIEREDRTNVVLIQEEAAAATAVGNIL